MQEKNNMTKFFFLGCNYLIIIKKVLQIFPKIEGDHEHQNLRKSIYGIYLGHLPIFVTIFKECLPLRNGGACALHIIRNQFCCRQTA